MIKKIAIAMLITITAFTASGCASKLYDAEVLHQKGAFLTKVTRKAKVAIRKHIEDNKLTIYVQEKYPDDMREFSDYSIIIKNHNGTAVVLMCNKERNKALLEDLSCTGSLEGGYLFKENLPCDFHLDVDKECKK